MYQKQYFCFYSKTMPQIVKRKKVVKYVTKRKRSSYSIEQKKEVITYVEQYERNKAAEHFQLNGSMVGCWVKASKTWTTKLSKNSRRIGSERKVFFPEAEKKLYIWIIEQRKQGLAVTYKIIQFKMLEILKESDMMNLYSNLTNNFKTSLHWLTTFIKRYKLSLRRRTKISQKLLSQTQELLENFYQFVTRLRIEKSFELCNILNMDETPVWFDMAGNFTVNLKGEKTVHIRETGNEKNRFTVVLTCAVDKIFLN